MNKYSEKQYQIDNAVMNLKFSSGAIGTFYTNSSGLSFKPWERVEIYGKERWLSVEDQFEVYLYDSEDGPTKVFRTVTVPNNATIVDPEFCGFVGEIENFAQAIRGVEKPIVTGWDGHRALELAVAARRSLETGRSVNLPIK